MSELVLVCGMSRSGTTLLTTILDSSPDISMGYELLSPGLPRLSVARTRIREAAEEAQAASGPTARHLEAAGHVPLARLVKRSRRALVEVDELLTVLDEFAADEPDLDLDDLSGRARLAAAIARRKMALEGTKYAGFKLNAPSLAAFAPVLGPARYVFILRDPRDIMASHVANDFGRTPSEVARAWKNYLLRFEDHAASEAKTHFLRYEDLVNQPAPTVGALATWLGLPSEREMLDFANSKASVHRGGHINHDQLSKTFFTSSVSRWKTDLPSEASRLIETECGALMAKHGYEAEDSTLPCPMGTEHVAANRVRLAAKKRFSAVDYEALVTPWVEGRDVRRLAEVMGPLAEPVEELTYIRHDIDHDIESALEIGRWEHKRGIRSTFCVLHTAWYYGEFDGHGYRHTSQMVDTCLELQELGHEINVHNNYVTLGLTEGVAPLEVLERELTALRGYGLEIHGTSTHGDGLCNELGYFNLELFTETPWHSKGGARTVEHNGNRVELGRTSMSELGLTYEAYDLPRDLYITDSGGRPRIVRRTRGRSGLRRAEMDAEPIHGHIVGLLTHPVYWDVASAGNHEPAFPSFEQLEAEYEERRQANRAARLAGR